MSDFRWVTGFEEDIFPKQIHKYECTPHFETGLSFLIFLAKETGPSPNLGSFFEKKHLQPAWVLLSLAPSAPKGGAIATDTPRVTPYLQDSIPVILLCFST